MAKSLLVQIEPTILKYARKTMGYSVEEVARKTKISLDKLQAYEDQKTEVPLSHLEKFAKLYKRPLAFFLLLKIPEGAIEPKDFRIVYASEEQLHFSTKYYLTIRRARYIQSILSELSDNKFEYKLPQVSLGDDVEKTSDWFRKFIGVDFDKQKGWGNASQALREWKYALESKDVFVLQATLSNDKISALCLADKKPYVIILNSGEHEYRRIFSLFHEIGHILLRKSGVCTPEDLSRNSYEYIQIEKFCNQLAASVLLPKQDFKLDSSVVSLVKIPFARWDKDNIKRIAQTFKVSREVFLRRLQTLGYVSEKEYEKWRNEWLKEADEYIKPKQKNIRIPQYIKCISQNGHAFTTFILNQYHGNRITFSTAADILNIAPKHIASLEAKVW